MPPVSVIVLAFEVAFDLFDESEIVITVPIVARSRLAVSPSSWIVPGCVLCTSGS